MTYSTEDIRKLLEPTRVHRNVYIDPELFDLEMDRIWGHAWIYIGHTSQVPEVGDFITTQIGPNPLIMVRGKDGEVRVLFNRCGHKGAKVTCLNKGQVKNFRCPYHAWTYNLDGSLRGVPEPQAMKDTGFDKKNPEMGLLPLAQVDDIRGFVFACMDPNQVDLRTFLGETALTLENIADRSPEGEVECVGGVLRYDHPCNWKMFIENLNDAQHPMSAHGSVGDAARKYMADQPKDTVYPSEAEIIFPFMSSYKMFDEMGVTVLPYGHGFMGGKMSIHSEYSDVPGYWEAMVKTYGAARTKEILSQNRHNTVFYPSFTAKDAIQAVRVVRPISVNRTIIESYHFRLKGAPDEMLKRTILYSRLINSSAGMVGPDDLDCYRRVQEGLASQAGEWVDLHRYFGQEKVEDGHTVAPGTSDLSFRNQYAAWMNYMTAGETA